MYSDSDHSGSGILLPKKPVNYEMMAVKKSTYCVVLQTSKKMFHFKGVSNLINIRVFKMNTGSDWLHAILLSPYHPPTDKTLPGLCQPSGYIFLMACIAALVIDMVSLINNLELRKYVDDTW